MKKVLVTGGTGFLGSHLCEKLLSLNNYVICLDNNYTGTIKNIEKIRNNKNFEFIFHDIINPIDLEVDEIYNLACPASPPHYQKDPIYTVKTNVIGIFNMINIALKNKAKILQASTSEVYGDPNQNPQSETYFGNVNPIGIRSCYDEGKRVAESILYDYKRMENLEIKIVRIFNTYGPNMQENDGRVVTNFIIQALKNQDITVYGDGKQTRSFCYVDDLICGIISLMNCPNDFSGPVNIGNDQEYSINEIANIIINLTNSKSKIKYMPIPSDDPKIRRPNLNLAYEKLNYKPKVAVTEGLLYTINYFREKLYQKRSTI